MAGESARREYERRRARDAQRRRRALPLFFGQVTVAGLVGYLVADHFWPGQGRTWGLLIATIVALKLGAELAPRSSTTAFAKGAEGEVAVAKLLDGLAGNGWTAFHDRFLPRGPQLDHLAVGPAGVFTIDAKRYKGKLVARRDATIRIAGRDKTTLLLQAKKQASAISAHLERQSDRVPPVTPVLCFVGTELPKHHLVIDGVHIVSRRGLKKLMTAGTETVDPVAVVRVGKYLAQTLRPALKA